MIKVLFFLIASVLYSIIYHLRQFFSLNLIKEYNSKNFEKFINVNNNFWKNNYTNLDKEKRNILITNFVNHAGYTITEAIITKNIQNFYNFNIIGLINVNDNFGKKLIKSFNINNFIVYPKINFYQRVKFLFQSFKIIKNIKNIDDFINLELDDINFGKPVYDHIIRNTAICSFNKISYKFFFFLADALFCDSYSKKVFENNNFEYMIMSERQFLPSNIIFQNALKSNVKVISRIAGPKKIGVMLYKSLDEKYYHKLKISKTLFNKIFDTNRELYSKKGFKKISDLFSGKTIHYDQNSKDTFLDNKNKNEIDHIYNVFNWDKSKKICAVFSHNLLDGNYADGYRLFRDNLTWLRETLKFIKNLDLDINWIIKDHPSDYGYTRVNTNTFKEFQNIIGEQDNIKFFPKGINTSLIKKIVDCLLTSQGSAGLEYPCFGIPSIIAGNSFYKSFGFTLEPNSKTEYFEMLKNMHKIMDNGLSRQQIDAARINYYIVYELIKVDHSLLFNFDIKRSIDLDNFFDQSTDLISKYKKENDIFKKSLKKQLDAKERHLIT